MNNTKEKAIMFGKAQCSAWVASAVDFGITLILTSFAGVWYGYSTFIGAVCGGITNCGINYRWVFHATGMKKKYMAMRYLFVWIGSIVLHLRNMAADRVKRSKLHHIENHRGCFCSSVLELSSTTHIRIPRQSCERIEYFI